jgi:hypothetical protein
MRDEDKPFICYRGGGGIKITPRNTAGWRAFGLWMAAFALAMIVWIAIVTRLHSGATIAGLTGGYLVLVLIWAIAMIRWMMARSEMVDMNVLLQLKRELDEQKRRGRR